MLEDVLNGLFHLYILVYIYSLQSMENCDARDTFRPGSSYNVQPSVPSVVDVIKVLNF